MKPISNKLALLSAIVATAALAGCERPTVVNAPPATPVVVPAPAPGPAGPAGPQGDPGKPGSSAVVVVPAPAASSGSAP